MDCFTPYTQNDNPSMQAITSYSDAISKHTAAAKAEHDHYKHIQVLAQSVNQHADLFSVKVPIHK